MKMNEIEQIYEDEWNNDELFEMARISDRRHGIPNVIIWVGETNKRHGLRIKVSNVRNKWSMDNQFIIQMPSLDYNHNKVAKWIDIEPILEWIKLNQELLSDYENGLISDTDIFLNKISPVKNK